MGIKTIMKYCITLGRMARETSQKITHAHEDAEEGEILHTAGRT